MLGMMPWPDFGTDKQVVPPGSRLYIYSDGCHEIHVKDGKVWPFDEFLKFMAEPSSTNESLLSRLLQKAHSLKGSDQLDDDFSILEIKLP